MLRALAIRSIVIVDALDLEFDRGLTTLTGETGAGKSILLDALGLALGARADASLAQPERSASVVAEFEPPADHPAWRALMDADVDVGDGALLLRRTIGGDGRSRAFVNDQPVSANLLRTIGDSLAEIHGQFDQHGLLDPAQHRTILDASGNLAPKAVGVAELWRDWQAAKEAHATATERAKTAERDEAFLRHAVKELEDLAAEPDEATTLADRRAFLMGRSRLAESLETAVQALEDAGAGAAIRKGERALARNAEAAAGAFDDALAALERAGIELDEAERALAEARNALDAEPDALEASENRLFALRDLARKHDADPDALPQLLETLARDLDLIDRAGERLSTLSAAETAAGSAYRDAAEALSTARAKAAARLEKATLKELPPLRLERADFAVEIERLDETAWGPHGVDRIRFLARANPGQPFGAMHKVASGGELARFALALRVVLAASGAAGVLVFDEVDSGVGGATAAAVGERLKRLSADVQTLVVTHSPQVAALGDRHYRVEKHETDGRVATVVRRLEGEARREEIARMLSGAAITAEARAQADRLLEKA